MDDFSSARSLSPRSNIPSRLEKEFEKININENFENDPFCKIKPRDWKNIPECLIFTFETLITTLNSFQIRINKFYK